MVVPSALFDLPGCALDEIRLTTSAIVLVAHTTSVEANCPSCAQPSGHLHSHYHHTPRDLPFSTKPVRLLLQVQRFFCDQPTCPRRTFAERLPDFLPRKAQRTARFTAAIQAVAFASSGEATARVGRTLRLPLSPDTALRALHQAPALNLPTPRVLGVDDFAFRKRHTYGTVLVDLERHQPVDLLPDRAAATLATWLEAHPGVEVIARDRSTEYARGAKDGAPAAMQVADRWHLLQNIREALERELTALRSRLARLELPSECPAATPRGRLKPVSSTERARQQQSRAERLARYERVKQLATAGVTQREIARLVGLSRGTVIDYLRAPEFPERTARQALPSRLDPYLPFLQQRWAEGCTNSSQLWRELVARGYSGGRIQVARWAQQQRLMPAPTTPKRYRGRGKQDPATPVQQAKATRELPPLRQLAWLLVKQPAALTDEERELLEQLCINERFAEAYELGQRFVGLVRKRDDEGFDAWLQNAKQSELPAMGAFATTLAQDGEAVRAALSERWSTGQVEGQITRLKCIKRQMYGRSSFELLRCRVLHRA
jgi:transposase